MRVKFKLPWKEYVGHKLKALNQTPTGAEMPNSTPMAPPIGYKKQPSMVDHIRNMVRSEHLRIAAEQAGNETFEEADDFDIPDDPVPPVGFEMEEIFEPVVEKVAPVAKPGTPPPGPAAAARDSLPAAPVAPASPPSA